MSTDDGLSHSVVNCILQDRLGFIWLGSQAGLNRYDGYRFKVFRFSQEDATSLSDNYIRCLLEDSKGRLWVGTSFGLNLLLPNGKQFKPYRHDPTDPTSLPHNSVRSLFEDREGRLWLGTYGGGLVLFDPEREIFTGYAHDPDDPGSISHNHVEGITQDLEGNLWMATGRGGLNKFDGTRFTSYRSVPNDPNSFSSDELKVVFQDKTGFLWLGGYHNHLDRFDPKSGEVVRHTLPESTKGQGVTAIIAAADGGLWLSTYGVGLMKFYPKTSQFIIYRHDPSDFRSLATNSLRSLYRDRGGLIWIGTYERGANIFNPRTLPFKHFQSRVNDPSSLSGDSVRAFAKDGKGRIWVGTDGGGLNLYHRETGTFEHFTHEADNPNSISQDGVMAIYVDEREHLWLGTFGGGLNHFDPERASFTHYRFDPNNPLSIVYDYINDIQPHASGALWLGTYGAGLELFHPERGSQARLKHDPSDPGSIGNDRIWSMVTDGNQLWMGTYGGGITILDTESLEARSFRRDPDDPKSLSHNNVYVVYRDPQGAFWAGTAHGLNKVNTGIDGTFTFDRYTVADGLSGHSIHGILMDQSGHMWISTNKGLSRLAQETGLIQNFDMTHGLQSNEFKEGAYMRTDSGELYFGGSRGFNRFQPKELRTNNKPPPVVITSFLKFNKPVFTARELENMDLLLTWRDSVFSFHFSALDYSAPAKNRYRYRLKGFDQDWVEAGNKNEITYTNLDAGEYTLEVMGSNNDGIWNETPVKLAVRITPPPWQTWWAYALYMFFIATVLIVVYQLKTRAQRREIKRQRTLVETLKRVDKMKDAFLANTSHELRTPLNGMIGLAESLIDGATGTLNETTVSNLKMIATSGHRLAHLINDILDFSKLKERDLEISLKPVDLYALVNMVLQLSQGTVGKKDLELRNLIPENADPVLADVNRLQQVMLNLVGNAVKFTNRGYVEVSVRVKGKRRIISVRDSGIGIAEADQVKIFGSFEQADDSIEREFGGTGLGLAITQQIVALHGGHLRVDSTPGKGATFSFDLAVAEGETQTGTDELVGSVSHFSDTGDFHEMVAAMQTSGDGEHFSILVVDDEPVNLQVLLNHLSLQSYSVTVAHDGIEAMAKIEGPDHFDLILLDIMMPRMSGYEVCTRVRKRYPAQDLPIVMLTAKNQIQDLVTGFEVGANDYITKPVSKPELISRIGTHLKLLKATKDLADYSLTLEEKVEDRTRELNIRNTKLEKVTDNLKKTQEQLIKAAHVAGMAEVATEILHTVGNTLNHVNISVHSIRHLVEENRPLNLLERVVTLIREKQENLAQFLAEDARGQKVPGVLQELSQQLTHLNNTLVNETQEMQRSLEEVRALVQNQIKYTQVQSEYEPIGLNTLVEHALSLMDDRIKAAGVELSLSLGRIGRARINEAKLNRALTIILENALEAMKTLALGVRPCLKVRTFKNESDLCCIEISDNGPGIPEEHQTLIFNQGFTTKEGHRGGSLHYAANAVVGMNGKIQAGRASAEGGTMVTLRFLPHRVEAAPET